MTEIILKCFTMMIIIFPFKKKKSISIWEKKTFICQITAVHIGFVINNNFDKL